MTKITRRKGAVTLPNNEMTQHKEFMNRIRKTLYYGGLQMPKCQAISRPLADYAAEVFSETHKGHSLHRLNYVTIGNVCAKPCSLILAFIYLDMLKKINPTYYSSITPSELFLVAMMVSTKFYCGYDEEIYVSQWAEYGNISVERMKTLELEFLNAMDWKVYVSNEQFFVKLKTVETILASRQSTSRGWLTYTELSNLMPSIALAKQLINFSTVLIVSYAAGVMAIASAFFLASKVPGTALYQSQQPKTNDTLSCSSCDSTVPLLTNDSESKLDVNDIDTEWLEEDLYDNNESKSLDQFIMNDYSIQNGILTFGSRINNYVPFEDYVFNNYSFLSPIEKFIKPAKNCHNFFVIDKFLPFVWQTFL